MLTLLMTALVVAGAASSLDDKYFTAAVFENKYFNDPSAKTREEILLPNIMGFQKAAEIAALKGADIILFSEYGVFNDSGVRSEMKALAEHIPDPKKVRTNPCEEPKDYEDRPILFTLSCMAKMYGMYVVGNLVDTQPCDTEQQSCEANSVDGCSSSCPKDGAFLYNADAVFDRKGYLISRYHKNHLYFEVMDTPKPYEMVTFETEFGVMGLFVCFDSLWKEAAELVKTHHVDTVIFSSWWFDDMIPLGAVEWQQSWALANNVNFVVANGRQPDTATLGSGIYSKKHGALVYTYSPDGKSRLLVAKVPRGDAPPVPASTFVITKNAEAFEQTDPEDGSAFPDHCYDRLVGPAEVEEDYRCTKEQFSLRHALTKLVDPSGRAEVCHNGLCCSVEYEARSMDDEYYLVAYNGTNDVQGFFKWAEEDCFLVRCDPFEGRPCATLPSRGSSTVFNRIKLAVRFSKTATVYPTVSKLNHRLAPKSEFRVETAKCGQTVLTYSSKSDVPLLKAGLMGRVYDRDPPFVPFYTF